MAAQNNNTIVVVNSVGPLIIEPWIDHPNVTAVRIFIPIIFLFFKTPRQVVWAGMAGPEVGNSLTDVLYGAWNPSGRLPYTIAKSPTDYPAQLVTSDGYAGEIPRIPYTEGQVILVSMKHKVVLMPD